MIYNIENVSEYLTFKIDTLENIDNETWDYPKLSIKSLDLVFPKYSDLHNFLYCMKRQSDFGTKHESKIDKIDISVLNKNVAFDSGMNIISNRKSEESIAFKRDIDTYHRLQEKGFWGNYIDSNTLEIGNSTKKEILNYSLSPSEKNNKKVLIQEPDKNHDESTVVYVNTELKCNKSLTVSYIFEKNQEQLIFIRVNKNDWIY